MQQRRWPIPAPSASGEVTDGRNAPASGRTKRETGEGSDAKRKKGEKRAQLPPVSTLSATCPVLPCPREAGQSRDPVRHLPCRATPDGRSPLAPPDGGEAWSSGELRDIQQNSFGNLSQLLVTIVAIRRYEMSIVNRAGARQYRYRVTPVVQNW